MAISRRRLFGGALAVGAAGVAVTSLGACSAEESVPAATVPGAALRVGSGAVTGLPPVQHVRAGLLNVGYIEYGPATGVPVLLLHGWPYDPHSYADVGPLLASEGYRVIVPYLRGYGPTTFLSDRTVRNGQQPLPPQAELGWWYQYYFATERGRLGYSRNRHEFNKLIWHTASPAWDFDDATYDRSATAFDNPDHVDIVVHNYRWRLGLAPGEPQYDGYERQLAAAPAITVPTVTVASDFDGATKDGAAYRARFTGPYEHRVLEGIGHNVPQETPRPFARAIIDAGHL
ncbi:alpha/beta fold hydrolase [Nocardia rhamnosiphila]|uniref:alpha/beta fold hydrolase n=1 Tax=Nocardia rhamnosiphila TaxID=426716 RepID=UPI0004C36EED|nr:alpha/beta hydrolase [Nocardia rhamnosiphila]